MAAAAINAALLVLGVAFAAHHVHHAGHVVKHIVAAVKLPAY
jgi:hypothetical protein